MPVTVIAEAGVNHNGRLDLALALIDAAADAGADVVKFQTFRADQLATQSAEKAEYQVRNTGNAASQLAMLKALELDDAAHRSLLDHCNGRGIEFLSTPFDLQSLDLLVDGLGLCRVKVGSGDLTNAPLLLAIARKGCSVILSTGMATIDEIAEALGVLAFGYTGTGEPSRASFRTAAESEVGRKKLRNNVVLLHCTSDYPAADNEINLSCMNSLGKRFGLPTGFSDHSVGTAVAIAAAARGAAIIEKHLTLDRTMSGPDHVASTEPGDFKQMIAAIRQVERALGSDNKIPTPSELKTRPVARKSIVASAPIRQGEKFSPQNLTVKRPGTGLPPTRLWDLIGRPASSNYAVDDLIDEKIDGRQ